MTMRQKQKCQKRANVMNCYLCYYLYISTYQSHSVPKKIRWQCVNRGRHSQTPHIKLLPGDVFPVTHLLLNNVTNTHQQQTQSVKLCDLCCYLQEHKCANHIISHISLRCVIPKAFKKFTTPHSNGPLLSLCPAMNRLLTVNRRWNDIMWSNISLNYPITTDYLCV